jgi:hypothetical protein
MIMTDKDDIELKVLLPEDAMKNYEDNATVANLEAIAKSMHHVQTDVFQSKIFEFETGASKFYESFKEKFGSKVTGKNGLVNHKLQIQKAGLKDDMRLMILDYAKEELGEKIISAIKEVEGSDGKGFEDAVLHRFSFYHGTDKNGRLNVDYNGLLDNKKTTVGHIYSSLNGQNRAQMLAKKYVNTQLQHINAVKINEYDVDRLYADLVRAAGHEFHDNYKLLTHNQKVGSLGMVHSRNYDKKDAHEYGIDYNEDMDKLLKTHRTAEVAKKKK